MSPCTKIKSCYPDCYCLFSGVARRGGNWSNAPPLSDNTTVKQKKKIFFMEFESIWANKTMKWPKNRANYQ